MRQVAGNLRTGGMGQILAMRPADTFQISAYPPARAQSERATEGIPADENAGKHGPWPSQARGDE